MGRILERLLEPALSYEIIEVSKDDPKLIYYVSEGELAGKYKETLSRTPALPGLKRGRTTALFFRNAQMLGTFGKALAAEENDDVLAVFFRDSDTTQSSARTAWQEKVNSIEQGFAEVEFPSGVPMVPNPKSEAWLICAFKQPSYRNCNALEQESGNDAGANPLKEQLASIIGDVGMEEQAELARNIDPLQIQMPSFRHFYNCLRQAAEALEMELPEQPAP